MILPLKMYLIDLHVERKKYVFENRLKSREQGTGKFYSILKHSGNFKYKIIQCLHCHEYSKLMI